MTAASNNDPNTLLGANDLDFDEHWLPGISFDSEDEAMNNSNSTEQNDNTMDERIVTPAPPAPGPVSGAEINGDSPDLPAFHRHEEQLQHKNDFDVTPASPSSRHVRIACHEFLETSHAPPIIPILTDDIIQSLWWKNAELLQMKRHSRQLMIAPDRVLDKDELLGLDRFTPERGAYKKRAIRIVLLAQRQLRLHNFSNDPEEYIRAVSRRCSHWARNTSHGIGQRVFQELYRTRVDRMATIPEEEASIEQEMIVSPSTERHTIKMAESSKENINHSRVNKRKASSYEDEGRRIQPRRSAGGFLAN